MHPSTPQQEQRREARTDTDTWAEKLRRSIDRAAQTPGESIRMCHSQGKTAVYLSEDETHIVEHAPDGTVRRTPL